MKNQLLAVSIVSGSLGLLMGLYIGGWLSTNSNTAAHSVEPGSVNETVEQDPKSKSEFELYLPESAVENI